MIKVFRLLDRAIRLFEEWTLFLSVAVALVAALANIILRKTTHLNLYWSDEVVRKVIFFTTYIGAVAAIRSRALIRIDALPQLAPVLMKPLTALGHLAVLFFSLLMVRLGWRMTLMVAQDEYARTATLQVPEWWFYAVLPVMGVLMFLRTLIVFYEDMTGKRLITEEKAEG